MSLRNKTGYLALMNNTPTWWSMETNKFIICDDGGNPSFSFTKKEAKEKVCIHKRKFPAIKCRIVPVKW